MDRICLDLDRIGTGTDLVPSVKYWIWIGSRSKSWPLDRIGTSSKKIGSECITARSCIIPQRHLEPCHALKLAPQHCADVTLCRNKKKGFFTSNVSDFLIFYTCLALVARKKEVSCDILSLFGSLSLPKNVIELLYFE